MTTQTLLDVNNLKVSFKSGRKEWNAAVEGVNFSVGCGEILGIVGESDAVKASPRSPCSDCTTSEPPDTKAR